MYLKDLTLRGFKSFASATRFRFEPGITAVVGPNGSGKSNVVDALAWVMGEQGAKSLRGGNMADVIFAGSAQRPALGRAQVELTIDNSDGKLPISYSEVTISRTMFRSGGSEYAINGQQVRLLDVQELLSDTGLGRQMHVIVGQGQLDAVLTATPQDRRAFIDEAAGVAKHRRRKERALRKLETMDGNLVRVLDLTEEIRRQLRPLARQAKAAREAAGVRERLDYARARLLAADMVDSEERLERERASLNSLREASGDMERQIRVLQEQADTKQAEVDRLSAELQVVADHYRDYRELSQRLSAIAEIATERGASAGRVPSAITDDAVQIAVKRAEEAESEAAEAKEKADEAAMAAVQVETERRTRQIEAEQARKNLYQQQLELEKAQQDFAAHQGRIERASAALAAAEEQLRQARISREAAEQRLASVPELDADRGSLDDSSQGAQSHYQQAAEAEQRARDTVQVAERDERTAGEALSSQISRRETLARSLNRVESVAEGVAGSPRANWTKRILSSSKGTLASQIRVKRGWEDAVTALLGSMAEARVISAGGPLHSMLPSDFSFAEGDEQPIPGLVQMSSTDAENCLAALSQREGSVSALSAVEAPADLAATVRELLGDCLLCKDLDEVAEVLSEQSAAPRRVATPDGMIFTSHSVRLPGRTETSTLRLHADYEDACVEVDHAQKELERVSVIAAAARGVLSEARSARESALEMLRASDALRAEEAQERARVSALHHAASQDLERAIQGVQRAVATQQEAESRYQSLTGGDVPVRPDSAEVFLAEARVELAQKESTLEQAREADSNARMAAHVAAERSSAMDRQARAFQTQAVRLREDRERQLRRESKAKITLERAEKISERAREASRASEAGAGRCASLKEEVMQARQVAESAASAARSQLQGLEAARGGAREHLLQSEVAFAQFQGSHMNLARQVLDFLGLSSAEVDGDTETQADELPEEVQNFIREFGPQHPWPGGGEDVEPVPFDRAKAAEQLRRAERELQRLGVVNPLAVEEHAALQSRLDFLLEQIEDLNRSKADLLELIRDVDAQVKASFNSAFEDTSAQYSRVFERLFPGGTGRLELTDPDDPLATGVEIYARPSGKKVTRLSLLSGGERSLAALAYLIAIFLARPSPFYVMDEVEAALDDMNLSRVLSLFEDLRDESQLLIITHQKRTMEIADALYGVSMKGGVTAVVSHRMDN
ncbi:chromosome segregation protein SMC [Actinomycetaceae bacterium MB13-C1-2]|nr:chromosome segregation protein SMC [Actinomycetaceae bacterium MB13-C1-2]